MWLRNKFQKLMQWYKKLGIQMMISISFTAVTVVGIVILSSMLLLRFSQSTQVLQEDTGQSIMTQMNQKLNTYLRSMMRLSDTVYYQILKNTDLQTESPEEKLELIYEGNRDHLVSLAVFQEDGSLVAAAPAFELKPDCRPQEQQWFKQALNKIENFHFSTPHVQNVFYHDGEHQWVISLSRHVELTYGGKIRRGVLLLDMSFSGIEQVCRNAELPGGGYFYITDRNGEVIYHPNQQLIYAGLSRKNELADNSLTDGVHRTEIGGDDYQAIVKTVGYTGWKLVGIAPFKTLMADIDQLKWFGLALLLFTAFVIIFVNLHLSEQISRPLSKLNHAVKLMEDGQENVEFCQEGCAEVQHLAHSIQSMVSMMQHLMEDIIQQEQDKRRIEMEVLQSQINPHFLYNTLDSVIWLTENERYEDATKMVASLGKLFRISLSRGKLVIPLKDELEHARHYCTIQSIRYKERFKTEIAADPDTEGLYTLKLIVQPILENAIYHGMAAMDEDGEISVHAWRNGKDLYIDVQDNGLGIPEETLAEILDESKPLTRSRGSGIGVRNIHRRIQLTFGMEYGLEFFSEPDEGTLVRLHLPAFGAEEAEKYQKEGKPQ